MAHPLCLALFSSPDCSHHILYLLLCTWVPLPVILYHPHPVSFSYHIITSYILVCEICFCILVFVYKEKFYLFV